MLVVLHRHTRDDFKESDHPRVKSGANAGQFGSKGEGSSASSGEGGGIGEHFDKFIKELTKPQLDMSKMVKLGNKLGSNEGGTYEDSNGDKFYVKAGKSEEHVNNEYRAAKLYNLAGANTLQYRRVAGNNHVATAWQGATKNNLSEFHPAERKKAQEDFAVHAWLANWDAVGTGGDNQAMINGKPTSVDLGGALEYRAQGGPKGDAFGNEVGEWLTMRNGSNDASQLFGSMTKEQLIDSASKVIDLSDDDIKLALGVTGGSPLLQKLIARRDDIKKKVTAMTGGMVQPAAAATPSLLENAHPKVKEALSKPVQGTFAEHVGLRELLKTVHMDQFTKKLVQAQVVESMETQLKKMKAGSKAHSDLKAKTDKYKAQYGIQPKTVAAANSGYAPATQQKAASLMKEAGVAPTPQATADFNDMVDLSHAKGNADHYLKHAKSVIANKPQFAHMSVGEIAHVASYTGGTYRKTNAQLRAGAMDEQTYRHVNAMNNALEKMPPRPGVTYRKADLPAAHVALYQPGMIVTQHGFTSSSKKEGTWSGDYHYVITGKTGRDIQPVSLHTGEAEVLFRSGTRFRVTKKSGNTIHMEEVDGR